MKTILSVLIILISAMSVSGQIQQADTQYSEPEAIIKSLFENLTFTAGAPPDWSKVKDLFLENAVIVLRTERDKNEVMSLDGWVKDFVEFIEGYKLQDKGFTEKLVRTKWTKFKDIASCIAEYEVSIPGINMPPQFGLDMYQLVKHEGRWYIVSIVNDVPDRGAKIPDELFQ